MDFLKLKDKTILVMGVANKKSVAFHVGTVLREAGARVLYGVRSEERRDQLKTTLPERDLLVCDVEREEEIDRLAREVGKRAKALHGLVHSIAFANYAAGPRPFHETAKKDFLQCVDISCYSLIRIAGAFRELLDRRASVVALSISTTRMAAESYGFMTPAKAALDSTICFLAKSFARFSEVRFNTVGAGLLKTSASAGIPGYVEHYLYAEQATLRKKALRTEEVADAVAFLLSERSGGINAQQIVLDAGMSVNYFDRELIHKAIRP
jgi:enoyl-[acyl-carrier protein] reductase I